MKLYDPEEIERREQRREQKRQHRSRLVRVAKANPRPRCACGCGKAAYWPREGTPVFHTRLCGYLMALEIIRRKAKA